MKIPADGMGNVKLAYHEIRPQEARKSYKKTGLTRVSCLRKRRVEGTLLEGI